MLKKIILFVVSLCLSTFAFALTEETGTLRGLVLGHCPTCEYDNWVSHVVEGVARPGYNDYGPAWFDPQTNGFGTFNYIPSTAEGDSTLTAWRNVFNAVVHEEWTIVDSILAQHEPVWRYELVRLHDTELLCTFYLLREKLDSSFIDPNVDTVATDDVIGSFRNGWGLFVFNPTPLLAKLAMEIPHPEDDFMAIPIGLEVFIRTNGRALMIGGASREAKWDTTQAQFTNSNSLSDPSRNGRAPFEMYHEALFDYYDAGPTSQMVTIDMHSYDHLLHLGHKNIQVSAFSDDNRPNPPLRDIAEHSDLIHFMGRQPVNGLPGHPESTCGIAQYVCMAVSPAYASYGMTDTVAISNSVDLPGFSWNRQGQYSHRFHNADLDPENFLHFELDEYPDNLWSPVQWTTWLPGAMPQTTSTYQLAIAYYDAFITAVDSSLRRSHLYPDITPPDVVRLTTANYFGADSVRLSWTPAAADRFFDTYMIYYDTLRIGPNSPYFTRTRSGLSALQDYRTTAVTIKNLTLPATRYKFAIASRDIFANTASRSNSSDRNLGSVYLTVADSYIGLGPDCGRDTLLLSFSETGYRAGQFFVILPPELEVPWISGTSYHSVLPAFNPTAHLTFAAARRCGSASSDTIEVNVQWSPPYSVGSDGGYLAAIPVRNQSETQTGSLVILGGDSTVFHDGNGDYVNMIDVGTATLYVDSSVPLTTFGYATEPACALGKAADLEGKLHVTITRGAVPFNSALASAWVEINGDTTKRISLFASSIPSDYVNSSFPSSAEASALWSWLDEGCNTLIVHALDAECNAGNSSAVQVTKDVSPPSIEITNHPVVYSPVNFQMMWDSLDISATLGSGCAAGSGSLKIWYGSDPDTFSRDLDVADFPASDSEAAEFWAWIVQQSGIPSSANGESYSLNLRAEDCAGNTRDTAVVISLDLSLPINTVTEFDARPTHLGVWLQWNWVGNTPPNNAVAMEVWRSPEIPGDYPMYPAPNPARWQNLADLTWYPQRYPPVGWTRVARQEAAVGTTSLAFNGLNGKGVNDHAGVDTSYWLDSDSLWSDSAGHREIYRYITFVQDAGGNWSQDTLFVLNQNADRSCNYWLGDFVPLDTIGTPASCGRVNSEDLAALSAHYFTTTEATWGYLDIGPEHRENQLGKGIPIPDGVIDFFDLLPFSDNYGLVAPVGTVGEYRYPTPIRIEYPRFDESFASRFALSRRNMAPIAVGDTIEIQLDVRNSGLQGIEIEEVELLFDPDILDVIAVESADGHLLDGTPFIKAAEVSGKRGCIGAVAAVFGDSASIRNDLTLMRIQFVWRNVHAGVARIDLPSIRTANAKGEILIGTGNALTLHAEGVIPSSFALYQNYPNPFNPVTTIRIDLPDPTFVRLVIYNILGQQVRLLTAGNMDAGQQAIVWDGRNDRGELAGSGVYVYRVTAGPFTDRKKMLMIR